MRLLVYVSNYMSTCSNLGSSLFCSGSSTAVIQSLQSLLSVAMRAAPPHGHKEEIWSIFKGIRYRQRLREDEPETWRPSAAAIRKVRDGEAALVEAAIAADKSLQSLLSVKMRPEPPHGHNDREIWLIERGILYRQCQRQKDADSAPDRRPLWIIVQEVAEQMGIPSSPSP